VDIPVIPAIQEEGIGGLWLETSLSKKVIKILFQKKVGEKLDMQSQLLRRWRKEYEHTGSALDKNESPYLKNKLKKGLRPGVAQMLQYLLP
jgi:hypothetical protein